MRYLTAGESHGPQLTTIIEGLPSLLPITAELINKELKDVKVGTVEVAVCRLKRIQLKSYQASAMAVL